MNPEPLPWLTENSYRAYPLKENQPVPTLNTYVWQNNIIVDAVLSYQSLEGITNVQNNGTDILITLSYTNNSVTATETFTAANYASQIYPLYVRNSTGNLLVFGEGVLNIPFGNFSITALGFEESILFETDYTTDGWGGLPSFAFDTTSLTGDIALNPQYQFDIHFNQETMFLGANSIYGLEVGCDTFGSVANDCGDIVSAINGASPDASGAIDIIAGSDIQCTPDPNNHRIYVGLNFNQKDICPSV